MCGIVGMAGNLNLNEVNKFRHMLSADVVRGVHATGIMKVTAQGEVITEKYAQDVNICEYFGMFEDIFNQAHVHSSILLGHNRHATKGNSADPSGAHPFTHGHITLVHNGSLTTHYNLTPTGENFTVDSEAICRAFELYGAEEVIPKLRGAFALVWYDSNEETLNFVRNEERDLALAYNVKTNKVYWASEIDMLQWILKRDYFGGVNPIIYDDIDNLEVGKWVKIPVSGFNLDLENMEVHDVEVDSGYTGWVGNSAKRNTTITTQNGGKVTLTNEEEWSKDAARTLINRGRDCTSIRNFVHRCDNDDRAVDLDGRIPVFLTGFNRYQGGGDLGTAHFKLMEAPYTCGVIYGASFDTYNSSWIGQHQGMITGYLSNITERADNIIISLVNLSVRKANDISTYEVSACELPTAEEDDCDPDLAKYYLDVWADSFIEPEEVTRVMTSDGSMAEVGGTVVFSGHRLANMVRGKIYAVAAVGVSTYDNTKYTVTVSVDGKARTFDAHYFTDACPGVIEDNVVDIHSVSKDTEDPKKSTLTH